MDLIKAILMGIVQGLTEFLPVSSSGHLLLFSRLLGQDVSASSFFEVLLHIGTLFAVFIVFWKDVRKIVFECVYLIRDGLKALGKREKLEMYPERKLALFVIASSIPTAVIGLLVEIFLEDIWLSSLVAVGFCLMITGMILFYISRMPQGKKKLGKTTFRDVFLIGIVQGISTLPGISRSGSTVAAGIFMGLNKEFAFRLSFLISIPAILGAALLKIFSVTAEDAANMGFYAVGMIVAAVVGYYCIRFIRGLIQKNKFYLFGYYCMAVGILSVLLGLFTD